MMWLEVIHVRVADQELDRLIPIFTQLIDEIRENESCRKVKLFRRALLKTDVCLHLYHDSENSQDTGSSVGLHLAAALKQFGMVNHTVWMVSDQAEPQ
jgi:hypothetical protein